MWKNSYQIGIDHIDKQHKELFRIVGELLLSLKVATDKSDYQTSLGEAIQFLKSYVVKHFAEEEEYMTAKGYADIAKHKEYHVELTQDVLNYEKQLVESDFAIPVIKKFLGFVNVWLIQHVAGVDQKYSDSYVPEVVIDDNDMDTKIIEVMELITGFNMDAVVSHDSKIPEDMNICFTVGLTGSLNNRLGFAFSDFFTSEVFVAMTGMELGEQDEFIVSAMSEISNVLAGHIVSIISGNSTDVIIKVPEKVEPGSFPAQSDVTHLKTNIGNMAVLVY